MGNPSRSVSHRYCLHVGHRLVTMDDEQESANEQPAELEGQLSINDYLLELGESPVPDLAATKLTDEEIAAFLEGEANK